MSVEGRARHSCRGEASLQVAIDIVSKSELPVKTAIDHLKEGLTLDPSSAKVKDELVKAWTAYGGKLSTQGNFGEAISAFEQALQLSPNQLEAYLGLAKSFFKKGDFGKALQAARKALSLDPGSDELKKRLLQILERK